MLTSLALAAAVSAAQPVVQTQAGILRGLVTDDGSVRFRAIPFANPATGRLRWRAPEPKAGWRGIRDATRPAPACPQPDYGWNRGDLDHGTSEDCLYLEVRTPSLSPQRPLPVMVWVHGGNATAGRASRWADGALHREGVVLVPIQYRLGALGWMAHPALSSEQGGSSGNYGLMDVQAALRWVRQNIAAFGGDPNNVTVFGSSAGAQIVHLAMQSHASNGLFARAILQSGSSNFHYSTRRLAEGEQQGRLIAAAAGLAVNADTAQLRALPIETLLRAQERAEVQGQPDRYGMFLAPLVDGRILTANPLTLLAEGRTASVPFIVGNSAQEERVYGDLEAARAGVRRFFRGNAEAALGFYGLAERQTPVSDERLGDASIQAATDIIYRCTTVAISRSAARSGLRVWQYQFDHGSNVTHASETEPLFAARADAPRAPLARYWANFARTGDPNGPHLVQWPVYDLMQRQYLEFSTAGPVKKSRLREPICELFSGPTSLVRFEAERLVEGSSSHAGE